MSCAATEIEEKHYILNGPSQVKAAYIEVIMSLTNKKNDLFSAGPNTGTKKVPFQKLDPKTRAQQGTSTAGQKKGVLGGISAEARLQKKQEAEKLKQEGEAYLKTSVFQWSLTTWVPRQSSRELRAWRGSWRGDLPSSYNELGMF